MRFDSKLPTLSQVQVGQVYLSVADRAFVITDIERGAEPSITVWFIQENLETVRLEVGTHELLPWRLVG